MKIGPLRLRKTQSADLGQLPGRQVTNRHQYTAQIVFIIDVEVNTNALNRDVWSKGPDPHPNNPNYHKDYGASWRSAFFPSTLAPVMYGENLPTDCTQANIEPRLHSTRINHNALPWFKDMLMELHKMESEPKTVDSFTFIRAELQLYDRGTGTDNTFGQLALYTEATTQSIGKIQEIFRKLTREARFKSKTRSNVPGSYLYDYLDSEEFKSLNQGLTDGIHFYDNESYLRDTEAKIYSAVHLRIDSTACDEIVSHINQGDLISGTPSWHLILSFIAANTSLGKLIREEELRKYYSDRIGIVFDGRYSLITRLGAAFITLNDAKSHTRNSELYFLAEHIDAIIISRLHDQILRNAEVRLVTEMSRTNNRQQQRCYDNFEQISEGVVTVHHQFIADSIRYWMDDVTANSGMGMVTLTKYKQAIGYQKRFDKMRVKLEDIAARSVQDQQDAASDQQEKLAAAQERFATIVAIIGIVAIPLPLLNDGLAVVKAIVSDGDYDRGLAIHFGIWLAMAVATLIFITWIAYKIVDRFGIAQKLGLSPYDLRRPRRNRS